MIAKSGLEYPDIVGATPPDGSFNTPMPVGRPINSEHGAGDLCLAPDEIYLIMTPTLPGGRGRGDLHVSFRQPDGKWGEFINLGEGVNSGKELLTLKGHGSGVRSVAFSPDGQRIVTGSLDQTAKVWDSASPNQVAAWQAEEHAAEQRLAQRRAAAEASEKPGIKQP